MKKLIILFLTFCFAILQLSAEDKYQKLIEMGPGVSTPKYNEDGTLASFVVVGTGRIRKSLPKQLALQQARKDAAREARNETSKFFNTSVKWVENSANEMVCVAKGSAAEDKAGASAEQSKYSEVSGEKSKAASEAALSGLRKIGQGYDANGLYCEIWGWQYKTTKAVINASKAMGKAARVSVNEAKSVEGARNQPAALTADAARNDSLLAGVQNIRYDNQNNIIYLQVIGIEPLPDSAASAIAEEQIKKIAQQNAIKHFGEFLSNKVSISENARYGLTMTIADSKSVAKSFDKNSEEYRSAVKTLIQGLVLNDLKIVKGYAIAIYSWGQLTADASSAAGALPGVPYGWIRCIGFGSSRESAVKAAMLEGIQQVFGASLSSNTRNKQRFASFVKGDDKGHFEQSAALQDSATNTLTETRGFIREYKIISVEDTSDGKQKAIIDANIVAPRGNGVRTVVVYPMKLSLDKLTSNFDVGPNKRLSGSEISALAAKNFEKAFYAANKFIVLNQNDIAQVIEEQKIIEEDVNSAKASPSELSKLGRLLTADYILISELDSINYSRKMGYNKALKKFVPVYSMQAEATFRLVSVENGGNVFNQTYKVVLSNEQITELLKQDKDADILCIVMQSFTTELNKIIP